MAAYLMEYRSLAGQSLKESISDFVCDGAQDRIHATGV